ncbi:YokU family protein [Bacillus aquiflavi]|uniref:YokU family protein n=1 Tax=Bacillus aquiflavi TaxID=2672567 RepID=A0A6B3W298_9BACI|nr:YokU family protein [Bacillus aquiflavi]MBA4537755.1 YokU family protein [Bacillus aquiflavi]NEY82011.1 YokU family protein [Bacillus aquiflavi]UAC46940.1 YokU family protein [Bacillus aquiflavi]
MEKRCEWCQSMNIQYSSKEVYWELPDGSRAIEIEETPTVFCQDCSMAYQTEKIVKEIEDQLLLIDTNIIDQKISFSELMNIPRLLKKNYFDFSS